ncbi:hypothetical protein CTI12_AA303550 [Artemisia annua]|uniref:Uncharacterized protein n=1 Tax=Artemisia annua TaxID=35608 RepID=A0A2U1N6I6_ARTAN|nr:hypothetical protein CTI12_AA303550 [Artemisia annua]
MTNSTIKIKDVHFIRKDKQIIPDSTTAANLNDPSHSPHESYNMHGHDIEHSSNTEDTYICDNPQLSIVMENNVPTFSNYQETGNTQNTSSTSHNPPDRATKISSKRRSKSYYNRDSSLMPNCQEIGPTVTSYTSPQLTFTTNIESSITSIFQQQHAQVLLKHKALYKKDINKKCQHHQCLIQGCKLDQRQRWLLMLLANQSSEHSSQKNHHRPKRKEKLRWKPQQSSFGT